MKTLARTLWIALAVCIFVVILNYLSAIRFASHIRASAAYSHHAPVAAEIKGGWRERVLRIYHKGSRRIDPNTISYWNSLDGVIWAYEEDYCVVIYRARNFAWHEIFKTQKL